MPKYNYILSNSVGVKTRGFIVASNPEAVKLKLQEEGQIIISIIEEQKLHTFFWKKPGLSFVEIMMFVRQLGTMIKVGVPIMEALEIIISQTREKKNRKMYENILGMIQSGQTLSKSLAEYGTIFPDVIIKMIETGEESGTLNDVMEYLNVQLEKEYEIRKKLVSAFIYPAVIIGLTLMMTMGIVIFIMPKITKIFSSFKIKLPFITQILIDFNTFVTQKPFLTVFILFATIFFFKTIFKLKALKPFWNRLSIYLPVFGRITVSANLARFNRTLSSLLQSGTSIVKALEIVTNTVSNDLYKKAIQAASNKVEQGGKLGESLENNEKLFPVLVTKMLYIGEKTGSLETTTNRLATMYEREVDNLTRNLSVLLEPLLLIFMGVLVGGIALAIILPIYQLPNLLQK